MMRDVRIIVIWEHIGGESGNRLSSFVSFL